MVYPKHLPSDPGVELAAAQRVRVVIAAWKQQKQPPCEEPRLAYNRVAMTSYFQHRSVAELSMVSMETLQEKRPGGQSSCVAELNVHVIFGRASSIDRSQKRVRYEGLSAGELDAGPFREKEYDELVLATGSFPFVPPVLGLKTSIPGIFLYRTIEDMDGIIARAASAPGRKAAVIGGGLLGLEAAKALLDLGMDPRSNAAAACWAQLL
eukprot:Skav210721  [mRNA]  locus=scaffold849:132808:135928:+ [translate_table: standard]